MKMIVTVYENDCQHPLTNRLIRMLAVIRFRVPSETASGFALDAERVLAVLGECAGFVQGDLGRAVDDPTLWVLVTRWANVGSYRRALSSYEVRAPAMALSGRGIDEPSAYEIMVGDGSTPPNQQKPRGGA
jgi:quinol monooxygenase YgiN